MQEKIAILNLWSSKCLWVSKLLLTEFNTWLFTLLLVDNLNYHKQPLPNLI